METAQIQTTMLDRSNHVWSFQRSHLISSMAKFVELA